MLLRTALLVGGFVLRFIEFFLFRLMDLYDKLLYSPLQTSLLPVVSKIPRTLVIGNKTYTVFTANIVSYTRTFLVIPIAICLKYQCHMTAFLLVVLHDFLDHVDGIVAKAHREMFGQVDDPLLGGFMDAFCDKIVNVFALWSVLMVTEFGTFSMFESCLYVGACGIIIFYEFILGVVRVQDYFRAYYERLYGRSDDKMSKSSTAAVMEGKLKEKLESTGIACLCLAQANACAASSISGIIGILCLLLSVRLAHASLQNKLLARSAAKKNEMAEETTVPEGKIKTDLEKQEDIVSEYKPIPRQSSALDLSGEPEKDSKLLYDDPKTKKDDINRMRIESSSGSESTEIEEDGKQFKRLSRRRSFIAKSLDDRVDRVYTVGCFDLFHRGHVRLLQRMRRLGKEVIVGVHDSRSILKLKSKIPIDSTETRMTNVNKYADVVFCVAGTDPTPFLECIANTSSDLTRMYVRGDDMQNFPARQLAERIMTIKFLPYSQGVSSTKLRKEQYNSSRFGPHINDDGHAMFY
ncbi:uncharacterized protein LOC133196791 [Saccostrea echinata]|uniref:uncharacterized protein LOC133196791 n=1 Tax=Saccostrea echinata TaxID=191078 RepID=UPI002A801C84|nr:uncharacterized protein LOC133196791 [Saccostrea echinata]